jgi:hypothetical protein
MVYYKPVFSLIRGFICPDGSVEDKLNALRTECVVASWPDKLNSARAEANTLVYRAFVSLFAGKRLKFLSNPRMQFDASSGLIVNLQPDLLLEVDGRVELWKFGTCVKPRKQRTVEAILRMFHTSSRGKGLSLLPSQIRFFNARTGETTVGSDEDRELIVEIVSAADAFAEAWNEFA